MASQLTADTDISFTGFQVVDRTDVIQTTTSNIVTGRCICTCHDPGRSQRYGMDLFHKQKSQLELRHTIKETLLFEGSVLMGLH